MRVECMSRPHSGPTISGANLRSEKGFPFFFINHFVPSMENTRPTKKVDENRF